MTARFRISPAAGAIALYDTGSNPATADAPLTDPMGNLARTYFHPALRYPGVVTTLTGSLALPAGAGSPYLRKATYTLAAHGRAGKPMLIGRLIGIGPGGADVAWCGSVPVQQGPPTNTTSVYGFDVPASNVRWLTLGANATSIIAYEICRGDSSQLPAITLSWEVRILDRTLTDTLPSSGPTRMRINGAALEIETPRGTFSTEKRYMKATAGAGSFVLAGGRTMTMRWNGTIGSSIFNAATWKWSLGSGNLERAVDYVWAGGTPLYTVPADAVAPRIQSVAF